MWKRTLYWSGGSWKVVGVRLVGKMRQPCGGLHRPGWEDQMITEFWRKPTFCNAFILTFSPLFSSQFLRGVDRMSSAPLAISPVGISPSACLSFSTVTVWTTAGTRLTRTTVVSEAPVVTARTGQRDHGWSHWDLL